MKLLVTFAVCVFCPFLLLGHNNKADSTKSSFNYQKGKGFIFESSNGHFLTQLEWRLQFRTAYPADDDFMDANSPEESIFLGISRARMKVGGHAFTPHLKYYMEYELSSSRLLDFHVSFEKSNALRFRAGQGKAMYNSERVISSGKQQTLDRSILTHAFTLDRQQGVWLYGNLAGERAANFSYWLSAFMGNGRGSSDTNDAHLLYVGRLQWNPNGSPLGFSGSDLEYHKKFKMLFALAAATNRSEYTRFSTSGGGQLEGFAPEIPAQYRTKQFLQESAGKYKGFSWQQELHFKSINDKLNHKTTHMWGNFVQIGYLPGYALPKIPEQLEFFFRQAFYFPDYKENDNIKKEITFGANWFVSGHKLKITSDVSYLSSNFVHTELFYGWRYRLQLDISL